MKNNEKSIRVKYIRNLEKFINSAISSLKKENFNQELFKERMIKNSKIFDKTPAINLNSSYTKAMQEFVNACLDFSLSKNDLLSKANYLDKIKNNQYKKEKHKNKFKDEL